MKKMYLSMLAVGTILLTSCAETEAAKEETYTLDAKATSLNWTGKYVADGHTHTGTVEITDGSLVYKGEEFVSGDFTIDMKTIVDKDLPSPMKDTLEKHLNSIFFFNTSEYNEAKVSISKISDKEIKATINVMGKDIKAVMPLKIKKNAQGVSAKGKFEIDFASVGIMGFSPMPGNPENQHPDTKIAFELNLKLKK